MASLAKIHYSSQTFDLKPAAATPITPPPPSSTAADRETGEIELKVEEEALEKHLASNPNDIEALKSLMRLKFKSQKLEQALEILNRLIEINPEEETEWRILKSQMQTYTGDFDSATKSFEEILTKDPFRVEAYHGLLMAYSESDSKLTMDQNQISFQDS